MAGTSRQHSRPVLDVPRSALDYVAEILAFGCLAAMVIVVALAWPDLPDRVPIHFGVTGEPDNWGAKWTLIIPPAIALALYLGLSILGRFSHAFNYPVTITEENAERQYRLARTLLSWIKAETMLLFAYGVWRAVRVAEGDPNGLNVIIMLAIVGSLFVTMGIYFWAAAVREPSGRTSTHISEE